MGSETRRHAGHEERLLALQALALQPFRNQERQFQRLIGIKTRIAMGVIAIGKIGFGNRLRTAQGCEKSFN